MLWCLLAQEMAQEMESATAAQRSALSQVGAELDASVNSRLEQLGSEVGAMRETNDEQSKNISSLLEDMQGVMGTLEEHNARFGSADERLDDFAFKAESLAQSVDALGNSINEAEAAIKGHAQGLEKAQGQGADLQNQLDELHNALSTHDKEIGILKDAAAGEMAATVSAMRPCVRACVQAGTCCCCCPCTRIIESNQHRQHGTEFDAAIGSAGLYHEQRVPCVRGHRQRHDASPTEMSDGIE